MTKRLKVYLLIVFAAACLACTLVGCKIGRPGLSELRAGYDGKVTYYSNGGEFNDSTTISVLDIYYKAGNLEVPFFNITPQTAKEGVKVGRKGYDFIGWYEPARYTAEDAPDTTLVGEIKYEYTYTPDADGNISEEFDATSEDNVTVAVVPLTQNGSQVIDIETDRPLFTRVGKTDRITEKDVTVVCDESKLIADSESNNFKVTSDTEAVVCAKWVPSAKINYYLIVTDETGKALSDKTTEYADANSESGKKYKNGDLLVSNTIVGDGETPADRDTIMVLEGLTFVKTYMDEEMTQKVEYVPRPEGVGAPATKVYCRYILGDWTVIRAADSNKVGDMFRSIDNANKKFLIMEDVDYRGNALALRTGGTTAATIICEGNTPLTISNLKFTINGTIGNNSMYSIFGGINKEFKVGGAGLVLKDINISLPSSNRSYYFYAVCTTAAPAAAANMNLTVDTITATYEGNPTINGVKTAEGGDIAHWICGEPFASDEAFLAAFTGIKLTGTNTITKAQAQS